jgi:tripartite ATP-independent transporter DctP family solute receptor
MKNVFCFLLISVLVTATVFAGGSSQGGGNAASGEKVILRMALSNAETSIAGQMATRIANEVNSKTKGVEIQVYHSNALGSSRDVVEGIQIGLLEMLCEGSAIFAKGVSLAAVADAPYVYRDPDHVNKSFSGSFGQQLTQELLKNNNVRVLFPYYYGTRQLSTADKPIYSTKDIQGLKIRVPEQKTSIAMVNSWGARATPITFSELYLALSQHVADGQENPLETINANKYYEVQKYIILTGHCVNPSFVYIYEPAFQKLSPEDQEILKTAVKNATEWCTQEVLKSEQGLQRELEAKGVTFITPDDSFRNAAIPALREIYDELGGKGVFDSIQAIK